MLKIFAFVVSALVVALAPNGQIQAQSYPEKPIKIIVPFSAGGSADRLARGLASFLTYEIGQPVVVENKPGGSALVGHKYFLQQPADGYTFLLTTAYPYIASNILLLKADFTLDDFEFINVQWADTTAIYVNKDRPWKTMSSLIDAIKASPGKLSMSTLHGSSGHVAQLALNDALGLPSDAVRIVTYEGGGESKAAAAGGTVDFTVTQVDGIEPIKDFVIPLGIFDSQRLPDTDAPTMNEVLKAYKTRVPNVTGSMRTFTGHPAFKKEHPDRYRKVVDALKRTLDRKDFKRWAKSSNIPNTWRGPDESKDMVYENFEVMKRYVSLFKK